MGHSGDNGQRSRRTEKGQTVFLHTPIGVKQGATHFASLCVHFKLVFTMLFISIQNIYSHVLKTLRVGRHSLWLPSTVQVIMVCGRALMLDGTAHRVKDAHSHPYKDCVPTAPKHLSRTRTKPPAQRRPLTSALFPQPTVHMETRARCRPPHVASGGVLGWEVGGVWVCGWRMLSHPPKQYFSNS